MKTEQEVRSEVQEAYGEIVAARGSCCGPTGCGPTDASLTIGYTEEQLRSIPESADLGLGCGNPTALANIKEGEVVVDLGSGAGLDAFVAARNVGESGRVIGVDMTPQMLRSARDAASENGLAGRVEFREGVIEALPIVDDSVDVVLSNCVVNLSPNKPKVFAEAFRILKPGGRLSISDICLTEPLPDVVAQSAAAYIGCVAGAELFDNYLAMMRDVGFESIEWSATPAAVLLEGFAHDPIFKKLTQEIDSDVIDHVASTVFSYQINAVRPG